MTTLARRFFPVAIFLTLVTIIMILLFSFNSKALRRKWWASTFNLSELEFRGVKQDDMDLVQYIRAFHIKPPAKRSTPYRLTEPNLTDFSQNGQSRLIESLLNGKKHGFFVEAGAYNGEDLSNTLYLEKELGWTGLLVEPDPWNFYSLQKRNRKAHSINSCLSPNPYPREVTFRQADTMAHIEDGATSRGIYTRIKCFPLYSLLLALNRTTIDYLSLDIEGAELQVLQTLPLDKLQIGALTIEFRHVYEGPDKLTAFLASAGYLLVDEVGDDYVYIRRHGS